MNRHSNTDFQREVVQTVAPLLRRVQNLLAIIMQRIVDALTTGITAPLDSAVGADWIDADAAGPETEASPTASLTSLQLLAVLTSQMNKALSDHALPRFVRAHAFLLPTLQLPDANLGAETSASSSATADDKSGLGPRRHTSHSVDDHHVPAAMGAAPFPLLQWNTKNNFHMTFFALMFSMSRFAAMVEVLHDRVRVYVLKNMEEAS
jgi:hypothetical protein